MLVFVGLVPQIFASTNSTLDEKQSYQNQLLGFSFKAPDGWTLQELKKDQPNAPDVAVVAPRVEGLAPVISISVQNSNGTMLDQFVKDQKAQLQPAVDSGRLTFLSEAAKKIAGHDAKVLETRDKFSSQNQDFVVKFKEVIILANDKFYTITYANQEKFYDDGLQSLDEVLNSFQILESNAVAPQNNLPLGIGIGIAVAAGVAAIVIKRKSFKKSRKQS